MEPIPETRQVLRDLGRTGGGDLEATMHELADLVVQLVPSCTGISLSVPYTGLTFTLVATTQRAAALDGVQYIDGGPCVDSIDQAAEISMADALDEDRWHQYAVAAATGGVRSSLSIPLLHDGAATGAVNLYAADPHAFDGKADALRALLGPTAGIAVTDADLPFRSRVAAEQSPTTLRDRDLLDVAVGFVAATHQVDTTEARRILEDAAHRATVDVVTLARTVLQERAAPDDL